MCNAELQAVREPKIVTSPGYPAQYDGNLKCTWTIRAVTDSILTIQVRFEFTCK